MYVGRGPPENCWGSGAPVQRTGGTGGSYGPALLQLPVILSLI